VNPSLSISAQAERAASLWPNKGENDLRPRQGEPYRRLDPIAPQHPVVPADAPGALRWLAPAGDDAERSDAEERRLRPGPISSAG
jgi:cholesterol oxidase